MDTRAVTQEIRLQYWAGVIKERQASGQSIRAWCRGNGIVEKTYYYWQRKLRAAACGQLPFTAVPSGLARTSLATPGFTEVRIEQLALPETAAASKICIETGRIRITTDSAYPPDQLAMLVKVISRPC